MKYFYRLFNNNSLTLLTHEFCQVMRSSRSFTPSAGLLPSSKWLASDHCASCCACMSVNIHNSRLDAIKELFDLFLLSGKYSCRQPIFSVVCKLDGVIKLLIVRSTQNGNKHLFSKE